MIINVRKVLYFLKIAIVFLLLTLCLHVFLQSFIEWIAPQRGTVNIQDEVIEVDAKVVSDSRYKHQLYLFWGNGE